MQMSFFEPIRQKRIHQIYNSNSHKTFDETQQRNFVSVHGACEGIPKVLSKHNISYAHQHNYGS